MQHLEHKNGQSTHIKDGVKPNRRIKTIFAAAGAALVMTFTSGCATTMMGGNPYQPGTPEHRRVEQQQENVNRQVFRSLGKFTEGTVEGLMENFNILGNSKEGKAFSRGLGRAAGDAASGIVNGLFGRDQHGRKLNPGSRSTGRVYDLQGTQQQGDSTVVQPENKRGKKVYKIK